MKRLNHGWTTIWKRPGTARTERPPYLPVHILAPGMETERSLMFAYVRLKSLMFAYYEKKYFFPALWPSHADIQRVGVAGIFDLRFLIEGEESSAARWWWSADLCGKNYGFLRDVSQSFTKIRTDQGRGYAILRIFTGGTLFSARKQINAGHGKQLREGD